MSAWLFWIVSGAVLAGGGVLLYRVRRHLELEAAKDRAFWARYHDELEQVTR